MGSLLCIRIPLAKTFLGFPASFLALVFWNSILIQRGGFIWWESYSKSTCGIVYKWKSEEIILLMQGRFRNQFWIIFETQHARDVPREQFSERKVPLPLSKAFASSLSRLAVASAWSASLLKTSTMLSLPFVWGMTGGWKRCCCCSSILNFDRRCWNRIINSVFISSVAVVLGIRKFQTKNWN